MAVPGKGQLASGAVVRPPEFVGRDAEMRRVRAWLDEAARGKPAVALIVGEAGIGKSRLSRAALDLAEARGFQTSFGRFVEDSATPFRAFADGILPHLGRAGLLEPAALGPGASALRLLAGLPASGEPSERPGEAARALAHGIDALARRRPLFMVVDDLHWAEPESIEMLRALVQTTSDLAASSRVFLVLLVLTRPPEPDSPLARFMRQLQREPIVTREPVSGLDEAETGALVRGATGLRCAPRLLEDLHAMSGGNPLFVIETLAELEERDALVARDGQLQSTLPATSLRPSNELVEAIASRSASLPSELRAFLGVAAVIGDEFDIDLLATVHGLPAADAEALLETASRMLVTEAVGDSYRFVHPLVRASLLASLPARRLRAVHMAVANQPGLAGRPMEVAHHMLAAGELAGPLEAAAWAAKAATEAMRAHAWGRAADFAEAALESPPYMERLTAPERRALILTAATALGRLPDYNRSLKRYRQMIDSSRDEGDVEHWAEALEGYLSMRVSALGPFASLTPDDAIDEFERAANVPERARVRVLCKQAETLYAAGRPEAGTLAAEALASANRLDDDYLRVQATVPVMLTQLFTLDHRAALETSRAGMLAAERLRDPWHSSNPLINAPVAALLRADLAAAERDAQTLIALQAGSRNWAIESLAVAYRVQVAAARGEGENAEALARRAHVLIGRSQYGWSGHNFLPTLARLRALRGQLDGARDALALFEARAGDGTARDWLALAGALTAPALTPFAAPPPPPAVPDPRPAANPNMFQLIRAAVVVETHDARDEPIPIRHRQTLERARELGIVLAPASLASIARLLAACARLEGDLPRAEDLLRAAIVESEAAGAHVELALSQLALGRLTRDTDTRAAASLLGTAAEHFEAMGFAACAEGARALTAGVAPGGAPATQHLDGEEVAVLAEIARGVSDVRDIADTLLLSELHVARVIERLGARHGPLTAEGAIAVLNSRQPEASGAGPRPRRAPGPGGFRFLLFTDIVESTPTNALLGDEAYVALLETHDQLIRGAVARHGGTVVKHTGDGMFAHFASARAAVESACEIQRGAPLRHPSNPAAAIHLRIGIHCGDVVERDGDLFGLAVATTNRVMSTAAAGEVMVSAAIRETFPGTGFEFADAGSRQLKGIERSLQLYLARESAG